MKDSSNPVTFTFKDAAACPKNLTQFWPGDIFYQHPSYGICDESRLCRMLGFDYLSQLKSALEFKGPFSLLA